MRKALLPPIAILLAILFFSFWNGHTMTREISRWRGQLSEIHTLAEAERWPEAETALRRCHANWESRQTYLHIVLPHDAVDDAGAMFRRAMAFAAAREPSEFRAELADLLDQLRLLDEMERFTVRNVL